MPSDKVHKGPGRNRCPRKVGFLPNVITFKPVGIPMCDIETVNIAHEELEAMRLVDLMGLDQIEASSRMDISRRSFAIDLKNGRRKILEALTDGKAISIGGGHFEYIRDGMEEEE